jgi:hypothetical protein
MLSLDVSFTDTLTAVISPYIGNASCANAVELTREATAAKHAIDLCIKIPVIDA